MKRRVRQSEGMQRMRMDPHLSLEMKPRFPHDVNNFGKKKPSFRGYWPNLRLSHSVVEGFGIRTLGQLLKPCCPDGLKRREILSSTTSGTFQQQKPAFLEKHGFFITNWLAQEWACRWIRKNSDGLRSPPEFLRIQLRVVSTNPCRPADPFLRPNCLVQVRISHQPRDLATSCIVVTRSVSEDNSCVSPRLRFGLRWADVKCGLKQLPDDNAGADRYAPPSEPLQATTFEPANDPPQ